MVKYNDRKKQRDISIDVVRCAAILCVIGVHSFSTVRDYWLGLSILRTLSVLGVPLFLLLTGYLNSNKSVEDYYKKGKWKKIIPNYVAYVILGSVCFFTPKIIFDDAFTILDWIKSILDFTCTPYGWYMNMWIGLFFLTPFLNIILQQIEKKEEIILILTILILSQVASFINRNENVFFISFWQSLWPLSFYFTGHFISKYQPCYKMKFLLPFFLICLAMEYLLNAMFGFVCRNVNSYVYFYGGHNMIVYYILGVVFFLILRKKVYVKNFLMNSMVMNISKLSFFMYLISAAFDQTLFRILKPLFFENEYQFFPYRCVVYFCTVSCAVLFSWLYLFISEKIDSI